MTPRKAPEAVLVALAEAVDKYEVMFTHEREASRHWPACKAARQCSQRAEPTADETEAVAAPGAYDWTLVPHRLWADLAHECCAKDKWANMRPELLAAVQAVLKAGKERPRDEPNATTDHDADLREAEAGNVCPKCGGSKSLCEYRERAARDW